MDKERIIAEWFEVYSDDIYNFLIYRVGETDVDDLLQEVFIKSMNGLDSYEGNANPKTWLFSIARHLAIDEIRRRQHHKWKSVIPFDSAKTPKSEETPEKLLDLKEENKKLYGVIQSLKANYRDVLILRGIKEFSVSETAEILGWTENKTRSTYHRAKQALKKKLGGQFDE
ncbi:RNA polymerase sigma factor [Alkalibacillus aidingensis]|uniref:RNA polymerase sigma factor n=1 Tax=Alkalibacillus aidingensis TaxID=2747607 RepID=UPI0016602941|nr:RNA polymerase sigma factor [Alkalibacillus aidingensis]